MGWKEEVGLEGRPVKHPISGPELRCWWPWELGRENQKNVEKEWTELDSGDETEEMML